MLKWLLISSYRGSSNGLTNVINYHLETYQWDESELDRLAKKLVPLLQERVMTSNAAGGAGPEPPVPFSPSIAGDHPLEDEREGRQRYSRWEREIVSESRHGLGTHEQLPPRYPMDRQDGRVNKFPIDIGDAEKGPYEPHLTERAPRNRVFKRALSYRTYRLKNVDQSFQPRQADRRGDY